MKPERPKKSSETSATTSGYWELLAGIKERVAKAQVRAHAAVSLELNLLYWQIGRDIVERQKTEKWGKSVVECLAADVQKAFPGIEGFSGLNVWRMRAFYLAWQAQDLILSQAVTELKASPAGAPLSRSILTLQIESAARKRHGKAVTNFKHTLPDPQSWSSLSLCRHSGSITSKSRRHHFLLARCSTCPQPPDSTPVIRTS